MVVGLAAAVAAAGGCASGGDVVGLDWCERTDSQAAVGYTYGVGHSVHVSFDQRGQGDLTVTVRTKSERGSHTMQAIMGEARFALPRADSTLYSAQGRELDCAYVQPDELGQAAPSRRAGR